MTEMQEMELLPCPFCGGTNIKALAHLDWVACDDCGASLEAVEPSARELWNTRLAAQSAGEPPTLSNSSPEAEQVWTASKYTEGPNSDGYYTAGIDISNAFPDGRTHFSAIEFHAKDKATAEARRDLVLRGAAQGTGMLRDCLQSIADADDSEPREPDDADWRFRFLEAQRAAQCALDAFAASPLTSTDREGK